MPERIKKLKQIETRQKWIETRLNDFANGFGMQVDRIEWCEDRDNIKSHNKTLAFVIEGSRFTMKLDSEDIQGSEVSTGIQEDIELRLKHILRTIKDQKT